MSHGKNLRSRRGKMREIILSAIVSSIISILMMTIQIKMIKKWLADFFDKQDEWLKTHFENLVKRLFL
jgi:hypothetical protein